MRDYLSIYMSMCVDKTGLFAFAGYKNIGYVLHSSSNSLITEPHEAVSNRR